MKLLLMIPFICLACLSIVPKKGTSKKKAVSEKVVITFSNEINPVSPFQLLVF
jgi:hypothetical protein